VSLREIVERYRDRPSPESLPIIDAWKTSGAAGGGEYELSWEDFEDLNNGSRSETRFSGEIFVQEGEKSRLKGNAGSMLGREDSGK